MNQLPENSLRIYDVTFSNIIFNRIRFAIECQDCEQSSYSQLPGSLSPDYKYLHVRQIPHQLSFNSKTIPDCIRYIIGVFCYNFKSQTNILASY